MIYQCVGIGVGPSNLSLASLLYPYKGVLSAFFDRKPEFAWHDGMYFPGATLQVSLFKDLVTLSDPTNPFSFISYLHAEGKIHHFLNARFESVPRREFRNYLKWASDSNENVHFGEEVTQIRFDGHFVVETERRCIRAENIAVGVGTEAHIPSFARCHIGPTQFHVSEYGAKAKSLKAKRVAIVGGGQSGAEAFLDVITSERDLLPKQVIWISRRENFLPLDDSPFVNDYFMPSFSEYFFGQDADFKRAFLERNVLASDGISEKTLREIYQRLYVLRFIEDCDNVSVLMPGRTVEQVWHDGRQWGLAVTHDATKSEEEPVYADTVIWATGFRGARMPFLDPLVSRLEYEDVEVRIDANFAAVWDGPTNRRIFMLNAARRQRGLAEPNLSLIAWRSQCVIEAVLSGAGCTRAAQKRSFMTWQPINAWSERQHRAV
ncbi:SidA/IucD/PvdA family monooxygenase [Bradyrhizobium sp. IC3195]|uniref:lysine N(6)-hydroxylase/L-ornithine N(5)-oxygenase family protein n=1 Tax=Bradyrhizobium sp. IC3195 TaxID=2793804 RepID=UPI001CD49F4F|nr:SidA/IucD/PvdA family monooxygenase [Bradyrhizobium sp. IC3195]MCA1473118.1 SidA/IucD/PvdA family monooxygenase [Bradyrhizobium sp. IC3195]